MSKEAVVIRMEAKHDQARELEAFLKSKVEQIKTEQGVNSWYLLKFSEVAFTIFASFSTEATAKSHLEDEVMKSILASADELMTKAPAIFPVELLASKIGDKTSVAAETPLGTKKYNLRFIDGL